MWKIKETKKIKEKMIDEEEEDDDKEKTTTSVALMSVSYQNQKSNETFLSLSHKIKRFMFIRNLSFL